MKVRKTKVREDRNSTCQILYFNIHIYLITTSFNRTKSQQIFVYLNLQRTETGQSLEGGIRNSDDIVALEIESSELCKVAKRVLVEEAELVVAKISSK